MNVKQRFHEEENISDYTKNVDPETYFKTYSSWLEQQLEAAHHEVIAKYPKHNSTEMINYLLVTSLRSHDKENRHILTKNLIGRDNLWDPETNNRERLFTKHDMEKAFEAGSDYECYCLRGTGEEDEEPFFDDWIEKYADTKETATQNP